jgi:hypothetical protein
VTSLTVDCPIEGETKPAARPASRITVAAALVLAVLAAVVAVPTGERPLPQFAPGSIAQPRVAEWGSEGRPHMTLPVRFARPSAVPRALPLEEATLAAAPSPAPRLGPVRDPPPSAVLRAAIVASLLQSAEAAYGAPTPPTAASDPLFVGHDTTILPAGMQNSNPGNIKFVAGQFWDGQLGPSFNTDQGAPQVVFDSAANGMLAAARLALKRFDWGHNTVRKLIADPRVGWTPGYLAGARGVASAAGFSLDQKLNLRDPATLARLLRGIVAQEHGPAGALYPDELIATAVTRALS